MNFLIGGNAFEIFYLPILGSKIKIVEEPSVTYQNLSAEKYKTKELAQTDLVKPSQT